MKAGLKNDGIKVENLFGMLCIYIIIVFRIIVNLLY